MSVWTGIDRPAFENSLSVLVKSAPFQDTSLLPQIKCIGDKKTADAAPLAYTVEQHLADGLAFLAATSSQPSGVTAASVHCSPDRNLQIVVAANQGLNAATAAAIEHVVLSLNQVAGGELSPEQAENKCRGFVSTVHRDRIFSRLASPKARHQAPTKPYDLNARLSHLLEAARKGSLAKNGSRAVQLLQTLISAIRKAEAASPGHEAEAVALKTILDTSYELMYHRPPILSRLAVDQEALRGSREHRALRALAYYWRVCEYLTTFASTHRELVQCYMLDILKHPPGRSSSSVVRYVHAEVQVACFIEKRSNLSPRYIGSSKKPCFLCYSFVRGLAVYGLRQSHGEVYQAWTIDDDAALRPDAREALNRALQVTVRDVYKAISSAGTRTRLTAVAQPMQTVSKILLDHFSESLSSIQERFEERLHYRSRKAAHQADSVLHSVPHLPDETSDCHVVSQCSVSTASSGYLKCGPVEIFVELHDTSTAATACLIDVHLQPVTSSMKSSGWPRVNVGDLPMLEECLVQGLSGPNTSMILDYGENSMLLSLSWQDHA